MLLLVENAELTGAFADVLSADEVKTYKPARAYGLAPQRLGVPASVSAFISSNFWDIAGAKSFGFWTGWVLWMGLSGLCHQRRDALLFASAPGDPLLLCAMLRRSQASPPLYSVSNLMKM